MQNFNNRLIIASEYSSNVGLLLVYNSFVSLNGLIFRGPGYKTFISREYRKTQRKIASANSYLFPTELTSQRHAILFKCKERAALCTAVQFRIPNSALLINLYLLIIHIKKLIVGNAQCFAWVYRDPFFVLEKPFHSKRREPFSEVGANYWVTIKFKRSMCIQ